MYYDAKLHMKLVCELLLASRGDATLRYRVDESKCEMTVMIHRIR